MRRGGVTTVHDPRTPLGMHTFRLGEAIVDVYVLRPGTNAIDVDVSIYEPGGPRVTVLDFSVSVFDSAGHELRQTKGPPGQLARASLGGDPSAHGWFSFEALKHGRTLERVRVFLRGATEEVSVTALRSFQA